jgi:hypothetical protein
LSGGKKGVRINRIMADLSQVGHGPCDFDKHGAHSRFNQSLWRLRGRGGGHRENFEALSLRREFEGESKWKQRRDEEESLQRQSVRKTTREREDEEDEA